MRNPQTHTEAQNNDEREATDKVESPWVSYDGNDPGWPMSMGGDTKYREEGGTWPAPNMYRASSAWYIFPRSL